MYINALGMRGINSQASQNTNGRTGGINQYDYNTVMQKALAKRNAAVGAASVQEGDMIITQPSYTQNTAGRKDVTDQEKNEMSMKEYRQWFRDEVSGIQSEAYAVSPYISDTLVIKEEAFEKMKNDPEWEKEVLGKIKTHCYGKEIASKEFAGKEIAGKKFASTKAIGYQIIGASAETCHEEGIPVNTSSAYSALNGNSPFGSLSYGYPYISSLYTANPLLTQGGYWNNMLTGQTGLSNYLTQGLLSGQSGLGMLASGAYTNVMNGGMGSSLLGNFLI